MSSSDPARLSKRSITRFQTKIWDFFHLHGRPFPWRETPHDPYAILVSEIMLQQTQTYRVLSKYEQFLAELPTFQSLAAAPLGTVLSLWQGLGYNRRAKALHASAKKVVDEFDGILPSEPATLEAFPGIGYATARSVSTFAYNKPTVFVETNIRAVYLHEFFPNLENVKDDVLLDLVAQPLASPHPRMWYYALMDYGVMAKKQFGNPSTRSAHHAVQSKFEGSDRQIRGAIIRSLTRYQALSREELQTMLVRRERLKEDEKRIQRILGALIKEGMVEDGGDHLSLPR